MLLGIDLVLTPVLVSKEASKEPYLNAAFRDLDYPKASIEARPSLSPSDHYHVHYPVFISVPPNLNRQLFPAVLNHLLPLFRLSLSLNIRIQSEHHPQSLPSPLDRLLDRLGTSRREGQSEEHVVVWARFSLRLRARPASFRDEYAFFDASLKDLLFDLKSGLGGRGGMFVPEDADPELKVGWRSVTLPYVVRV